MISLGMLSQFFQISKVFRTYRFTGSWCVCSFNC